MAKLRLPTDRRMVTATLTDPAVASIARAALFKGGNTVTGHIDTHHHFLPKVYIDSIGLDHLASVMPNKRAPTWSVEQALAVMDGVGTQEAILSISSGLPVPNAAKLLRDCNDIAAELKTQYPGRFGSFASLPLPDIDASLKEIEYSADTLHADGFIIFTNYDGTYLGDIEFAPVMEELNRRNAVAFIHPSDPPYALRGLPPTSVMEFPFDTTRTAASLILSGSLKRWPDIRFILSHAGGALPFMYQRLAGVIHSNPEMAERVGDINTAIKSFWFDTALSINKPAMAALLAAADPNKILFGTDFPMAPLIAIEMSVKGLNGAALPNGLREGIFRDNAAHLLGRDTHELSI